MVSVLKARTIWKRAKSKPLPLVVYSIDLETMKSKFGLDCKGIQNGRNRNKP